MIVVCDTSPVNYLVLIGEIDLLPQLFTTVVLPVGVLTELQHPRRPSWPGQRSSETSLSTTSRSTSLSVGLSAFREDRERGDSKGAPAIPAILGP
jgi:predicted nucleic acid-binding protein